jgi:DNA polymerase-3 subunit beta
VEKFGEVIEGIAGEKKTLIPRKALSELAGLLGATDSETMEFADDDSTLFFKVGGRVLTSRKLTGQFPNYEAVLPRDNNKFAIVRSEDLMGCIQRVAQFADERSGAIKIRLEQNELKLSAGGRLQLAVSDRLPEGDRHGGRSAAGVQGRAERRADAA